MGKIRRIQMEESNREIYICTACDYGSKSLPSVPCVLVVEGNASIPPLFCPYAGEAEWELEEK